MIKRAIIIISLLVCISHSIAQELENDFQYRVGAKVEWEAFKDFEVKLEPQARFDNEGFDLFLTELGIQYKTFGFLTWGLDCRFLVEPKKKRTELNGRYGAFVSAKKRWGNFTPSIKVYYTNYIVSDNKDDHFLRYKATLKYDITNCKFTPFISAEFFHQLIGNHFYKMRYAIGGSYSFKEYGSIFLSYRLDAYHLEPKLKHIFSVGYKYKFKNKK